MRRILLKNGEAIALNPKAFDLLLELLKRHGEIVAKNDLLDAVWENQFVEEKNLAVQVTALRKAFGERKDENRFIATVPGRGYKFVAPLNHHSNGNSLVIETQQIQRITIEEEIVEDRKKLPEKSLAFRTVAFYLLPFILLLLSVGFFWWNNRQKVNPVISVKRLTTNGKVQLATLSPDGKLFAYVADEFGKKGLWLGYTSGGNNIQLRPPNGATYYQLNFSPDSSQLYFSMSDAANPDPAIYRIPVLGGVAEKIATEHKFYALSTDGKQIAYRRGGSEDKILLMVSDLNGANEREVFTFPKDRAFVFGSVSWSPDSQRMAFSCQREGEMFMHDLCLAEISSRKIERITLPNYYSIQKTAWLKSNDGVVVTAIPKGNNSSVVNYQILQIEVPGGKVREITNDLNTYNSDISVSDDAKSLLTIEHRQLHNIWVAPTDNFRQAKQITFGSFGKYDGLWGLDWTPDGRIVYNNSNTETQIISVMNADGSGQKDLTSPGFMDSALTVSNDGRYVVFHSIRGKPSNIWRMDIDGGNLKQLTFGNKSFSPSVSPNNRYVYFKSWLTGIGELRRVPIDGGEEEILTDKQTDWTTFSPDGKFFAAVYLTDKRRLAIFSAETNELIKQFDLPKTAVIDMRPRWTPDNKSIIYRDGVSGYWSQSIADGKPSKLEGFPEEELFTHAFSKDGKQFAFVRGQVIRDVILINNFR